MTFFENLQINFNHFLYYRIIPNLPMFNSKNILFYIVNVYSIKNKKLIEVEYFNSCIPPYISFYNILIVHIYVGIWLILLNRIHRRSQGTIKSRQ